MKPKQAPNVCLAALIEGGGFGSLERFAQAVNVRGGAMLGIKLSYDHVRVRRWLNGGHCQNPDVVAVVLSDAWGIPIPAEVIWPELRDGSSPPPPHLQPWVAARTLESLSTWVRSDMLTRREVLAEAFGLATGGAFVEPLARWLRAPAIGLAADGPNWSRRVGMGDVEGIERATRYFAATDAESGGGLAREAAVGQLKYAVDLARHASYSDRVGIRLLAAIADLAGWVGFMCHDIGMEGPAQRYFTFALQAAKESGEERARFRAVGVLCDMALQTFLIGDTPDTGLRLLDLAFDQLPRDGRRLDKIRSHLWALRSLGYAGMGGAFASEARTATGLSFELYGKIGDEDNDPAVTAYFPYVGEAELAHTAARCYRLLASESPILAVEATRQAQHALVHRPDGFTRSKVFDQIELARSGFAAGEPDQACDDGEAAVELAGNVSASRRVVLRLHELLADVKPYEDRARVREFRERMRGALAN